MGLKKKSKTVKKANKIKPLNPAEIVTASGDFDSIVRLTRLSKIEIPLRIMHSHLNANERIDHEKISSDILKAKVDVVYEGKLSRPETNKVPHYRNPMSGFYAYNSVYRKVVSLRGAPLKKPIESILDNVVEVARKALVEQDLIGEVSLDVERFGLCLGRPRLCISETSSGAPTAAKNKSLRFVGMSGVPLSVVIDHGAWPVSLHLEHVPVRHEQVVVSFGVWFPYQKIGANLAGVFNYAECHNSLMELQGWSWTKPTESLVDVLLLKVLESAKIQGVKLARAAVTVKRTGYILAEPTIGAAWSALDYRNEPVDWGFVTS